MPVDMSRGDRTDRDRSRPAKFPWSARPALHAFRDRESSPGAHGCDPRATPWPHLLAACTLTAGCAFNTPVLQRGANERMGVLLNYSCGAHPCDAIDPCKPTIVLTHGWNPLPNRIRCTFGPASAKALKCRCGDSYNILSWDWNAVRVPLRSARARFAWVGNRGG